jgi:hypothetical protein
MSLMWERTTGKVLGSSVSFESPRKRRLPVGQPVRGLLWANTDAPRGYLTTELF